MKHSNLCDLVTYLESGTNLHIRIVFQNDFGNYKTALPENMVIHTKPFCTSYKNFRGEENICLKCSNEALKRADKYKKPFGKLCFEGIYEYCYPIIEDGIVIAVIFIGNILSKNAVISEQIKPFENTFEKNFSEDDCKRMCLVLENHIKLLIREYSDIKNDYTFDIANIKSYIDKNIYSDFSVRSMAAVFNYNEQYIGKMFKKHTGKTIKEYLNLKRLEKSGELLRETNLRVSEVSLKLGFRNASYFCRLFKKYFDISPTEYRKKL